jgi:hypothetical protein
VPVNRANCLHISVYDDQEPSYLKLLSEQSEQIAQDIASHLGKKLDDLGYPSAHAIAERPPQVDGSSIMTGDGMLHDMLKDCVADALRTFEATWMTSTPGSTVATSVAQTITTSTDDSRPLDPVEYLFLDLEPNISLTQTHICASPPPYETLEQSELDILLAGGCFGSPDGVCNTLHQDSEFEPPGTTDSAYGSFPGSDWMRPAERTDERTTEDHMSKPKPSSHRW